MYLWLFAERVWEIIEINITKEFQKHESDSYKQNVFTVWEYCANIKKPKRREQLKSRGPQLAETKKNDFFHLIQSVRIWKKYHYFKLTLSDEKHIMKIEQ